MEQKGVNMWKSLVELIEELKDCKFEAQVFDKIFKSNRKEVSDEDSKVT